MTCASSPSPVPGPASAPSPKRAAAAAPLEQALAVNRQVGEDGRLLSKTESDGQSQEHYAYTFDQDGHLTEVTRNGRVSEQYSYNRPGQRVASASSQPGKPGQIGPKARYDYDDRGRMTSSGEARYDYDLRGNLRLRRTPQGDTRYEYAGDTRLAASSATFWRPTPTKARSAQCAASATKS